MAECSGTSNPFKQLLEHAGQDRSLQQGYTDRPVQGPSTFHSRPPVGASSGHGEQAYATYMAQPLQTRQDAFDGLNVAPLGPNATDHLRYGQGSGIVHPGPNYPMPDYRLDLAPMSPRARSRPGSPTAHQFHGGYSSAVPSQRYQPGPVARVSSPQRHSPEHMGHQSEVIRIDGLPGPNGFLPDDFDAFSAFPRTTPSRPLRMQNPPYQHPMPLMPPMLPMAPMPFQAVVDANTGSILNPQAAPFMPSMPVPVDATPPPVDVEASKATVETSSTQEARRRGLPPGTWTSSRSLSRPTESDSTQSDLPPQVLERGVYWRQQYELLRKKSPNKPEAELIKLWDYLWELDAPTPDEAIRRRAKAFQQRGEKIKPEDAVTYLYQTMEKLEESLRLPYFQLSPEERKKVDSSTPEGRARDAFEAERAAEAAAEIAAAGGLKPLPEIVTIHNNNYIPGFRMDRLMSPREYALTKRHEKSKEAATAIVAGVKGTTVETAATVEGKRRVLGAKPTNTTPVLDAGEWKKLAPPSSGVAGVGGDDNKEAAAAAPAGETLAVDADEMREHAQKILEQMGSSADPRFQSSGFRTLMERIAQGNVEVRGSDLVVTAEAKGKGKEATSEVGEAR